MVIVALATLGIIATIWFLLTAICFAFICRELHDLGDVVDNAMDAAKIATAALVLLGIVIGCIFGISVLISVIATYA